MIAHYREKYDKILYPIPGFTLNIPKGTKDHSIFTFTLTPDKGQENGINKMSTDEPINNIDLYSDLGQDGVNPGEQKIINIDLREC